MHPLPPFVSVSCFVIRVCLSNSINFYYIKHLIQEETSDSIYRGKKADTLSKCQRSLQISREGASKAQVSLHTPVTVLPEPLLLLYLKYRS